MRLISTFLLLSVLAASAFSGDRRLDSLLALEEYQNAIVVRIESLQSPVQGQYMDFDIVLERSPQPIKGFDLRVGFDSQHFSHQEVLAGPIVPEENNWSMISSSTDDSSGTWQYYDSRQGQWRSAKDVTLRSIHIQVFGATTRNSSPAIDPADLPGTLTTIRLLVTNDYALKCSRLPIAFMWSRPEDNAFLTDRGRTGTNSCMVYNSGLIEVPHSESFPCQSPSERTTRRFGGSAPYPLVFVGGGLTLYHWCPIESWADININGVDFEPEDAAMFAKYFLEGLEAFEPHVDASVAASDVYNDGITLSLSDLVAVLYPQRNARPRYVPSSNETPYQHDYYSRTAARSTDSSPRSVAHDTVDATARFTLNESAGAMTLGFADTLAAVLMLFEEEVTPELLASGLTLDWKFFSDTTRVLVYSTPESGEDGTYVLSGPLLRLTPPVSPVIVEAATLTGRPVRTELQTE